MKKFLILGLVVLVTCCMTGCKKNEAKKLEKKMMPLAENYLATDGISEYDSLKISSIDTITELGYAKIVYELLENMEAAYQNQYDEAVRQEDERTDIIELYLKEITRTKLDFYDLMNYEDLKTDDLLLYMVTGSYKNKNVNQQPEIFMFFVNPDSLTLYTLDPFGDNLLYKD